MRAIVIYSSMGGLKSIVDGIKKGLEETGFAVQLVQADEREDAPIALAQYDLIVVGSPVLGAFGGQVASDIDLALRRVSRADGKTTVAFVKPKLFGARKSLTRLMALLEKQGAWVQDFATLRGSEEAARFGRKLEALVRNRP